MGGATNAENAEEEDDDDDDEEEEEKEEDAVAASAEEAEEAEEAEVEVVWKGSWWSCFAAVFFKAFAVAARVKSWDCTAGATLK